MKETSTHDFDVRTSALRGPRISNPPPSQPSNPATTVATSVLRASSTWVNLFGERVDNLRMEHARRRIDRLSLLPLVFPPWHARETEPAEDGFVSQSALVLRLVLRTNSSFELL